MIAIKTLQRRAKIWLVLALVLAAVYGFLSAQLPDGIQVKKKKTAPTLSFEKLPEHIESLNELRSEVLPLDENQAHDWHGYPAEFKDKRFISDNGNKWTLEIMDVAEHKIISNYLDGRNDREKFAYFRYTDINNKERYVLTYGLMSSFQEAMGASKLIAFGLPSSARIVPEEMGRYLTKIDAYQRTDLSSPAALEKVQLEETTQMIVPKAVYLPPPPPIDSSEEVTPQNVPVEVDLPKLPLLAPNAEGDNKETAKEFVSKETTSKTQASQPKEKIKDSRDGRADVITKPIPVHALPQAPAFEDKSSQ